VDAGSRYYSVTSCDVLKGSNILLYNRLAEEATLYQQTFGPISYLLVLISAAISVAGVANCSSFPQYVLPFTANALMSIVVCLCLPVPFITQDDRAHFLLTACMGLVYAALSWIRPPPKSPGYAVQCCLHALDTVICCLYRSPETPYAPILCSIFVTLLWTKVFLHCQPQVSRVRCVELNLGVVHVALLAQAGLCPQFVLEEHWPVYAVVGLYISYAVARHC
jgi:hypothetical protein